MRQKLLVKKRSCVSIEMLLSDTPMSVVLGYDLALLRNTKFT